MTAAVESSASGGPWPAQTLDAVVHAITACGRPDLVADFEAALGRAWTEAREQASLEPLTGLVEEWWIWAAHLAHDPRHGHELYQRVALYRREGPPPPETRVTREQVLDRYGV